MNKNRGSVSIEASISLPLFLFVVLFFIHAANIQTVKGIVYEGAVETAEYMAEYAYFTDCFEEAEIMDYPMATLKFWEYVDSKELLKKYIVGGEYGVTFLGSQFPDEDGFIDLRVTYFVHMNIPLLGVFNHKYTEHIRQRAYLGRRISKEGTEDENSEIYVYVAENGVVYHLTRSCTYLLPEIHISSKKTALENGYRCCGYCGAAAGDNVYITSEGDCYHSSSNCSRIRRSVSRKKLSEVNLPPCSKCAK